MQTTITARASVVSTTLLVLFCCPLVTTVDAVAQDFNHQQPSSYARVQYANNNTTRRFNIQRDPTIQYITFDELYNKYNQEKNNNKNDEVVVLGSSAATPPLTPVDPVINNVHRRWEDVPDLGNGWSLETTTSTTTTTTAETPAPLNAKGANHMYAYSSAYQNANNEFNAPVDRDGSLSTTMAQHNNVPASTTTLKSTTKVTTADGAAEYAHAVGGEEVYGGGLTVERTTTAQPVVMEASWNDNKPTKNVVEKQRPAAVVDIRERVHNSEDERRPTGKVSAAHKPTSSSSSKFSTQEVHMSVSGDGDQSSWRPFMGPSVPQVVNPAVVRKSTMTSSPPFMPSTANTLFYDETKNNLMIFPPNKNNNTQPIIPVGIIVNENSNVKPDTAVRRHPLVPVPSSSQRPDPVQILVIPNLAENEVKTTVASSGQQAGGIRFPSDGPQTPNFIGQTTNFRQPNFNGPNVEQQRPSPQFGQRNPQEQLRPQSNQFNQQQSNRPAFGLPNDQRPSSSMFLRLPQNGNEGEQRPSPSPSLQQQLGSQFLPGNHHQVQVPTPNRFNVGTAQMNDERFIAGIPGPRGPHRIPSGPVGLPPQLVPQLQGRPTNAPHMQQQGTDIITIQRPGRPPGTIGSSIDNPLPGPPIPLPGIPSGPIVIANLPGNNKNNNGIQNTQDRNGPNGPTSMFRPNFNRVDHVPDRSDAEIIQNHDNFIHQQEQLGGQMNPNNLSPNFRPHNFPMPPRGPPPPPPQSFLQQQQQQPQPTSSPSLIKSLFSRFFPFGRSLDTEGVPLIDSDTLANWTLAQSGTANSSALQESEQNDSTTIADGPSTQLYVMTTTSNTNGTDSSTHPSATDLSSSLPNNLDTTVTATSNSPTI